MSRRKRALNLLDAERLTLEQARDHHPLAYVRERAAALLRIAAGEAAYQVALTGVLRARHPETLYCWLTAYEHDGLASLRHKARRGRAFSPTADQRDQRRPASSAARPR
jgi:transposase